MLGRLRFQLVLCFRLDRGFCVAFDRVRMRLSCTRCGKRSQALRIVYVGPEGRNAEFRYRRANPSAPDLLET